MLGKQTQKRAPRVPGAAPRPLGNEGLRHAVIATGSIQIALLHLSITHGLDARMEGAEELPAEAIDGDALLLDHARTVESRSRLIDCFEAKFTAMTSSGTAVDGTIHRASPDRLRRRGGLGFLYFNDDGPTRGHGVAPVLALFDQEGQLIRSLREAFAAARTRESCPALSAFVAAGADSVDAAAARAERQRQLSLHSAAAIRRIVIWEDWGGPART